MAKKAKKKEVKNVQKGYRPPIVTIMGHVDHGKTSILDAIRESQITHGESGGITQHIGAYTVEKDSQKITFIDTPGHEAFTKMRERGGKAADIVILVVAADDGVMPQTKEAIMHAKAAGVPMIVAINKVDLPGVDINKVKSELARSEVMVEGYGGDIVTVEVSATVGTGIPELLDVINLVSEMDKEALEADENGVLEAIIIESEHDSKRGTLVSAIVKNGKLSIKDDIIVGEVEARVKALTDSYGKRIKVAVPGDAIEIMGFTELPQIGDIIRLKSDGIVEDVEESVQEKKVDTDSGEEDSNEGTVDLEELDDGVKKLNLVIRADTAGTLEAIIASINKIRVEDSVVNIMFGGTGEVKESDVLLASTGRAIIMAFKAGVPNSIKDLAETKKVLIREHEIIYKMLEEIEVALEGVLEIEEGKIKGRGIVIKKFTLPKSGMVVAGTLIEAGQFKVNSRIGIFRGSMDVPLHVTRIRSIGVGQKDVEKAGKGEECGLLLKPQIEDIELDDIIEIL